MDKFSKLICKNIYQVTKGSDLSLKEFKAHYLAELAFLYVTTYGIPEKTVFELMGWERGQ